MGYNNIRISGDIKIKSISNNSLRIHYELNCRKCQYENATKYLSNFKSKCPKFLVCCEKIPLGNNDSKVDFKRVCVDSIYNISHFSTLRCGKCFKGVCVDSIYNISHFSTLRCGKCFGKCRKKRKQKTFGLLFPGADEE